MTLTIIFDKDVQHVLMCNHAKQRMLNYIGGHVRDTEQLMDASYREVEEETGITRNDITLYSVREEHVSKPRTCWRLHVTCGVCNKYVTLRPEKNTLQWVALDDLDTITYKTFGNGNCYTYLVEALDVLKSLGVIK